MALSPRRRTLDVMAEAYRSGDALVAFGEDMQVTSWNAGAERLTGLLAEDAVGRPCWEVLGALDRHGELVCHSGCSGFRQAREGRPSPARQVFVRTTTGRRRVSMATVTSAGTYLHVLSAVELESAPPLENGCLTARQREVLELIAAGQPAKVVAQRLRIAEVTVRNHIRAILLELGCHSQLEAVAEARRRRLLV